MIVLIYINYGITNIWYTHDQIIIAARKVKNAVRNDRKMYHESH